MIGPVLATWRDLLRYLRHPVPIVPQGLRAPGMARVWMHLLLLDWLLIIAALPLLGLWAEHAGQPSPEILGRLPLWQLIPLAVVILPAVEECAFRGWLTGRPRNLWLGLCALAVVAALALARSHAGAAAGATIALAIAAPAGWWRLRRRTSPPGWFIAGFVPIFYTADLAFALAHLGNYPHADLRTLPMVLPQLWGGLLLGYARQRISLGGSILLHGASNGIALSLALLGA